MRVKGGDVELEEMSYRKIDGGRQGGTEEKKKKKNGGVGERERAKGDAQEVDTVGGGTPDKR